MLYDTHCHPYLAQKKSQDQVLENFFWSGWVYLNSIWCDIDSSIASIELAKKYLWAHASIWIHPTHVLKYSEKVSETISKLKSLYGRSSGHVVAIGESWLDYYWLKSLAEESGLKEEQIISLQKKFFMAQIDLAKELKLPLVIHNREASKDIFQILSDSWFQNFVFHCYSEDLDFALKLIELAPNCKLWFWWVLTFKNALKVQEVAQSIPLKNIIIETDSPYLTPAPYRGKQENEPILVKYVLEKLIELRSESPKEIREIVFENSVKFFIKK